MIYLLRHGQTDFNLERRIQGRLDSPLTGEGRVQAEVMGRTLRDLLAGATDFEIVAAPEECTNESAAIVREATGLTCPVITDARLQEVSCGSWEHHHFASICARDPMVEAEPCFLAAWARHCTDGEGLDAAMERLWGWLRWAGNRNLVVVGHGVAGSILRALYVGEEREAMLRYHSARQDRFHRLESGWAEEIVVAE
ncbi:MAG: histidine phosphatase family protein [Alteraurantiacibacter sp.]